MIRLFKWASALGATVCFASAAWSADAPFPNRPITIIVTASAGSSVDTLARAYCSQLQAILGQPCVVDNHAGADGIIGISALKRQRADGHSLLIVGQTPIVVNPLTKKNLPYNPSTDLKVVQGLFKSMNAFIVAPDSPFKGLQDLVHAGASGRPPSVGTSFTAYRLGVEWFSSLAGTHFTNIPYKGNADVVTATIGKQLDAGFVDISVALQLAKSGKVRVLAVAGANRSPDLPDVPTVRELGYPSYESAAWNVMFVRAETPPSIVSALAAAVRKASESEALKGIAARTGLQPIQLDAGETTHFIAEESARYQKLARAAGISPE